MTAPINTPTTGTAKDAASARKRRRRAPAGGAADDCFTCAKRNVKCDRRRPYCSQCLEIGNECSGYKTQLTWGVGVASRGKLRGLSLPIAKAPPVNNGKTSISTLKSPTTTARSRTTSIVSAGGHWGSEQDERAREDMEMGHGHERSPSVSVSPFHSYDMSHMSPSEPAPPGWTHIPFSSSMAANDGPRFPPPRPLHINVSMPGDMMHRELIHTPIDTMSDVDYMSPIAHSFPREEVPQYLHSPLVYEGSHGYGSPIAHSPPTGIMIEPPRAPTSCPGLVYGSSEPASSLQSHMSNVESLEAQLSRQLPHDRDALVPGTPDLDTYSTSAQSHGPFWAPSSTDEESVSQSVTERSQGTWPSSFHSQSPSPVLQVNSDLISKMPFFMDYYEKTMCPSMVFIDGPNNPFREHILRLGANSRSLQHAICALAACNLRMKRKLSLGHHAMEAGEKRLDGSPIDSPLDSQPRDQSLAEEYQHRNLAVRLLDEQLNDPEKSLHDSVLATILLLCHYRMAESGIAKFHTQFAGVKKILGMRRMSPYPPSRDSAWMEALFTYFDAISASVNDREAQLNTSFYGVLPDALLLPPGAENLVGCDRELFRIIIKLGRLNLLSQHRPVQNLLASSPLPRANAHSSRSASPLGASFKTSPLLGGPDHHHHHTLFGSLPHPINSSVRFDGNGFSSALEDDDMLSSSPFHNPTTFEDQRNTFWREWKEARISLQGWKFDAERVRASLTGPPSNSPSSPHSSMSMGMGIGVGAGGTTPPPTSTQIDDLCSLSEAFRYAALLYTERLAYPNFPSNRDNFRNLVTQVVYWATSLQAGSSAEKFLLWPLFVAGSECVNELQQNIVRNKCREIMARSGYMNNLAALDVLERLWAGEMNKNGSSNLDDRSSKHHHSLVPPRGGPFNWIKLTGNSSEVEWIMF